MSYKKYYSEEELKGYEIISNWEQQIRQPLMNITGVGKIAPLVLYKKIFDLSVDLTFNGEYIGEVSFYNCYFKEGINFKNAVFGEKFLLHSCIIEGEITTSGSPKFNGGLFIKNTSLNNFSIEKGDFTSSFWGIKKANKLSITGGTFSDLNIYVEEVVNNFYIDASKVSGDIFYDGNNTIANNIQLKGTSTNLSLFINKIIPHYLHIDQYVNEKRLKIANVESFQNDSRILISHSQLGKAEFSSVDFSNFKIVAFEQSNLVDCIFNNITWSETVFGATPHKIDKKSNALFFSKSRETFRQLKYSMSKQGDVINEQKFHALEMGMYFETLSWRTDFWTKLIIFLSWLTSDFGQSFWRPLLFIFVFHSGLFLLPLLFGMFTDFKISFYEPSNSAFWMGFETYFFLMNPLRKPDQGMFHGIWIVIDIFMRVSSSYMIYNMIRATRRFIK